MDLLSERESIRRYLHERYGLPISAVRRTKLGRRASGIFIIRLVHSINERLSVGAVQCRRQWQIHYEPKRRNSRNEQIYEEVNSMAVLADMEMDLLHKSYIEGYWATWSHPAPLVRAELTSEGALPEATYHIAIQGVDGAGEKTCISDPIPCFVPHDTSFIRILVPQVYGIKKVRLYAGFTDRRLNFQEEKTVDIDVPYTPFVFSGALRSTWTDPEDAPISTETDPPSKYLYKDPIDLARYNELCLIRPNSKRIYVDHLDIGMMDSDYAYSVTEKDQDVEYTRASITEFPKGFVMLGTRTNLRRNFEQRDEKGAWLIQQVFGNVGRDLRTDPMDEETDRINQIILSDTSGYFERQHNVIKEQ